MEDGFHFDPQRHDNKPMESHSKEEGSLARGTEAKIVNRARGPQVTTVDTHRHPHGLSVREHHDKGTEVLGEAASPQCQR